jgi:alkyl hydroperoxide reductase subunit AhpC
LVKLSDYRGKWVVLFFYPLDFTFVCPTEIRGFNEYAGHFRDSGAEIVGASTDSKHSHLAWINGGLGKLSFPLASDITRRVAGNYGILLEDKGHALRGSFIIDPEGVLKWHLVHYDDVGRNVDETLRVLKALQTGTKCPVNWKEGEATL